MRSGGPSVTQASPRVQRIGVRSIAALCLALRPSSAWTSGFQRL